MVLRYEYEKIGWLEVGYDSNTSVLLLKKNFSVFKYLFEFS